MTQDNDQRLAQFFKPAAQQELPDNGFSRKVMRRLPDDTPRLAHLVTIVGVAAMVTLVWGMGLWESVVPNLKALFVTYYTQNDPVSIVLAMLLFLIAATAALSKKVADANSG